MVGIRPSGERVVVDRTASRRPAPPGRLDDVRLRAVRETLAVGLARQGYSTRQIDQILGVESVAVTWRLIEGGRVRLRHIV